MRDEGGVVLILGSGPSVVDATSWPRDPFDQIVVINNAWRVRSDWDFLCYPEDFPQENQPQTLRSGQRLVLADAFVPAQNAFGGFVFAGATMAFTTAYWVLHALRPRVMGFLGCDMVYAPAGPTHFYGKGTADPLRDDVSLRNLEAKSARLGAIAAVNGCACVNLSNGDSRLVFPRVAPEELGASEPHAINEQTVRQLRSQEDALGYATPDGRYPQSGYDLAALDQLDEAWRSVFLNPK